MGIIYKLMKHRNLTMNLNKTHKNPKTKSDRNRLITIEGNIIDTPLSASTDSTEDDLIKKMDSSEDKQFTAEHIIQLCKFLAEKSKRNKNLYKQQQSPKKLTTKAKQSQFQFQPMEYDDNDNEVDFYPSEALPLLSKQQLHIQQTNKADDKNEKDDEVEQQKSSAVLSMRLSPDINSLNISSNTKTVASCALQHYQQEQQQQQYIYNYQSQQQLQPEPPQNQGKRDILLKIRRQIFERKRLRENGLFEPQPYNNSQVWRPW